MATNEKRYPLLTLLNEIQQIREIGKEKQIQTQNFRCFPNFEKTNITKFSNLSKKEKSMKTCIKKAQIDFTFNQNFIDALNNGIKCHNKYNEFLFACSSWICISWCFDDKHKRTIDEFISLMHILFQTFNLNPKISFVCSYAFMKLLKTSIKPNVIQWNENAFQLVFSFLILDTSLQNNIYMTMIRFFTFVNKIGSTETKSSLICTISSLISENRECIDWEQIDLLQPILKVHIQSLDKRCLNILSMVGRKLKSEGFIELFKALPSSLLLFLGHNEISTSLNINDVSYEFSKSLSIDSSLNFLDEREIIPKSITFSSLNHIHNTIKYKGLFGVNALNTIKCIGECLRQSLPIYSSEFFSSYTGLISILKSDGRYLQFCASLIIIMEIISNKSLLNQFILIIIDTIIFMPTLTIYSDQKLDYFINFLRNKVIKIIGKIDPEKIFLLLNNSSKYPILQTELFVRIIYYHKFYDISILLENDNLNMLSQTSIYNYQTYNTSEFNQKAYEDNVNILLKLSGYAQSFTKSSFMNYYMIYLTEKIFLTCL